MTYDFLNRFNVGDYIQSLVARQFLPRVDRYLCREALDEYAGPETKVILNGFFMRRPEHWPPAPRLRPLFLSFHLNAARAERMLTEKGITYLQSQGPIGCRDWSTLHLLQERGIASYFSNCLTLTLGRHYRHRSDDHVFFVDVLFRYPTWKAVCHSFNSLQKSLRRGDLFRLGRRQKALARLFGADLLHCAEEVTHVYPAQAFPTEDARFELADRLLKRYETARLVVTSRIHCALPCLAMGTPVIFVNGGFPSDQACRFGGLLQLLNTVDIHEDGTIQASCDLDQVRKDMSAPVRNEYREYVPPLVERCEQFVAAS